MNKNDFYNSRIGNRLLTNPKLSLQNKKKLDMLRKLHHFLTYESLAVGFFFGIPFVGMLVVSIFMGMAILSFIPLLIKTLILLKKWNWLIALPIMLGIPFMLKLTSSNILMREIFSGGIFLMFFLYCFLLKFSVHDWIQEVEYGELDFENENTEFSDEM
jgi:hypothetical protein